MRLIIILCSLLIGCTPEHDTCPPLQPLKKYTPAEEHQASKDIEILPLQSPVIMMLGDYGRMRAQVRAVQ